MLEIITRERSLEIVKDGQSYTFPDGNGQLKYFWMAYYNYYRGQISFKTNEALAYERLMEEVDKLISSQIV